jgi:hypothetical protein
MCAGELQTGERRNVRVVDLTRALATDIAPPARFVASSNCDTRCFTPRRDVAAGILQE